MRHFAQFTAFALVGLVGTSAHYALLYVLVESEKFNPVAASGCGAVLGLLVNYALNYQLTFKSKQLHRQTFPKFATIAGFGLGINLALMAILTPHVYYFFAQIFSTLVVLLWNFVANSRWTFQMDISNQPVTPPSANDRPIFTHGRLLVSIFAIRLITLGFYPLYDPSESRYAEMGRKMLELGDWITPMIDYGVPFWGKPPLTVWLTALSLGLGGVNDFFARWPSLLLSIGIGGLLFHLGTVQRGRDYAWNVVLILASSVLFFVMAGTVAMDIALNFGITLALTAFWLALRHEKSAWGYLFFVGLSIGLLAKGPITLVLCGLSIGLWTAMTGAWRKIWQRIPWLTGTLLMLALSAPWYLLAEQKTPGFLNYFIVGEHWKRFTESGWQGDLYGNGHAHPRGMIWIYGLAATFPWCLFLIKQGFSSIFFKNSTEVPPADDGWRLYCGLWLLSPLLFFSFSANIIWTYALPGLPGFALLVADYVKQPKWRAAFSLCVPVAFAALVTAYHFSPVSFYKSQQRLIVAYQHRAQLDEPLLYLIERPYSAQFYLHGKAGELPDIPALQTRLATTRHAFYVLKQDWLPAMPAALKSQLQLIQSDGRFMLFYHQNEAKK